jgi:hypothetical protein
MLIGLGKMVKRIAGGFSLLASRVLGFTTVSGGGSSYYTTSVGSSGTGYLAKASFGGMAYSSDGINWKNIPELSFPVNDYVYGNGMWLVVGSDKMAKSTDGVSWTINNTSLNGQPVFIQKIHLDFSNKFILEVDFNGLCLSSDGETITKMVEGDFSVTSFAYANTPEPTIVYTKAGQYDLHTLVLDANGSVIDTNLETIDVNNIYYVSSMGDTFFALPFGGTPTLDIKISIDGITWDDITITNGETRYTTALEIKNTFAEAVGKYILVGGRTIAYSDDLLVWNTTSVSTQSCSFAGEFFVASQGGTYSDVVYLRDGANNVLHSFDPLYGMIFTPFADINWETLLYANNKLFSSNFATGNLNELISLDIVTQESVTVQFPGMTFVNRMESGIINSYIEVQVAIGNQGSEGAEILAPVDVYTVPVNKTTNISQVTIKNNSLSTITYDLSVLNSGITLNDSNATINDQAISAGETAIFSSDHPLFTWPMSAGQRIVVFPSSVDVVEVKVFGTESNA